MKPYFLTLYIFLILTNISFATEKPVSSDNFYISFLNKNKEIEQYSNQELQQNFDVTEMLLNIAIQNNDLSLLQKILPIYRSFSQKLPLLVFYAQGKIASLQQNYKQAIRSYRQVLAIEPQMHQARLELAQLLFYDHQNKNAEQQFHQINTLNGLSPSVHNVIQQYLDALKKRNDWNTDLSFYYVKDKNINKVAGAKYIENTPFQKNNSILPQTATGVYYSGGIGKDFNLNSSHYLAFSTELNGETYWDNHSYDELTGRVNVGYRYKNATLSGSLLPFYQYRWSGGEKYQFSNGVETNLGKWLNSRWQVTLSSEYSRNHYFKNSDRNGHSLFLSAGFYFVRTPQQAFYFGGSFQREKTNVVSYSSKMKSVYVGWVQEWGKGISSQLNLNFALRHYDDEAFLPTGSGLRLYLGKQRKDKIYSTHLMLWKRDWHLLGVTPKLKFSWKQQKSNLSTMYSYKEKNVHLIFEKSF